MKKIQRIAMFALAAALALLSGTAAAGVICSGSGASVRIDTRTGVRPARAEEPLAYSTAWNGTGACSITLDGEPLLSNATGTGDYVWNAAAASTSFHTLTFNDGVETSRAVFHVGGGGALVAWGNGEYGQCDVPDGTNFVQVAAGEDFAVGLKSDGTVELWGDGAGNFSYNWTDRYDEELGYWTSEPDLSFNHDFVQIGAHGNSWIGLRSDGSIYAHEKWCYAHQVSEAMTNSVMIAIGGQFYGTYGWAAPPFFGLGADGVVHGWAQNEGDLAIPGRMNGAVAIASGNSHLLTVKADGTVQAWLFNSYDWYLDEEQGMGVVPSWLSSVKSVAVGGNFCMALRNDGSVVVWGDRYDNYGVRNIPADTVNVIAIAAGNSFCVALRSDGRIVCWGVETWNDYRETDMPQIASKTVAVGTGPYCGLAIAEPGPPVFIAEPSGIDYRAGQAFSLSAEVFAAPRSSLQWIRNGVPIDGADSETIAINESVAADSGDYRLIASNSVGVVTSRVARVTVDPAPAVGRIHRLTGAPFVGNRLVLRAKPFGDLAGVTYTWKRDGATVATTERLDIASLKDEDFGTYTLTVTTPYGTATSEPFVLAPAQAGVPIGWGADDHGRTTAPEGLTGLAQVASGMNFNLGLSTNGTVTAWGYNGHGACDVPAGLSDVAFVAAGGYESQGAGFAVKTDGSVVAWGRPHSVEGWWEWRDIYDEYGEWLGDEQYWSEYTNGWDTVSTMPTGLSDVVKVAVGGECAIALHADGTITAWGSPNMDSAPADLSDVVDVAAGSLFMMALRANGTVVVWNDGNTYYDETKVPAGLSDVVAIAAGKSSSRTCFALRADGTIVKWGDRYDYYGLGRGTAAGAVAVDAGQEYLMALDADGGVCVWSDWNNYDVCGVPEDVENALAIAAGGYHCTALVPDSDGDSICDAEEIDWGRDPLVWEDWRRVAVGGTVATGLGPVAGALVQFFDANGNLRGRTRTDEDGAYCVANLLPAPYTVKVEADGAVDAWYDGVTAAPGAVPTPYAVAGGSDIDDLDFLLAPGQGPAEAGVTGLEPDGGEEGNLVEVALPEGTVAYLDMWPAEMDADGTIDIGEVASAASGAASHTVTLKLPGAGAAVPSPGGVKGREGERVPVAVVTDGPRGSLAIATEPAGATVYVDYADTPLGVTPLSVGNLLAGSHTILLKKDGYLRPRPVVATVAPEEGPTEVAVPLNTPSDTNEMTVAVTCVLPDQEIYLDYLPTDEVAPATVGGMDPASHAGAGWYSASHSILLRHPMVRPWAPRYVPEPSIDAETGETRYDSALEIDGPQLYDDGDGDGVRNDIAIAEGRNPFYTMEEALDATNLLWTTGGDRKWRAVKTEVVPTGGYGQSGVIGNGETTWVETTVKGAGTISFKWKTSCKSRPDMVVFTVDGANKGRLFGETGWTDVAVVVTGVTNHVLRWSFSRGASGEAGENCAWLDEVSWEPDAAANARTLTVESRYGGCDPAPGETTFAWGDEVSATASGLYSNGFERATCTGWSGTGSVPATGDGTDVTFTIEQDSALTWSWNTEFMLDLGTAGEGSLSRESGWFAEGAMAIVTATPGLYQRFARWEGDTEDCRMTGATIRAPMTRGRSLRAVFEPDTRTLAVGNCLGMAWPTNGVHEIAMGSQVSAWSTNLVDQGRTQFVCTGWTGMGSVPATGAGTNAVFTLLEDSAIAWTWRTNYLVSVTVVGDGSVDFTEGWVEAGSNLVVTATAGAAFTSAIWSGDIAGAVPDGLRITVPVDGPKEIAITFAALGIGRALEQERRDWTTGAGGASWIPVTEGTHDGVDACRSGLIGGAEYGESGLSTTFTGPGDLSFWWKLDTGSGDAGIDLIVDGEFTELWLIGDTVWTQESITLGEGTHTVKWVFWSDGLDPSAAAWLDEVAFDGDEGNDVTETQTTPVPVPHAWLAGYLLGDGTVNGYEDAAKRMAANGVNKVWECYVAGLNPTNAAAAFCAVISIGADGKPVVEWNPRLTPEEEAKRVYTIYGRERIDVGGWTSPTNSLHRFFKVEVEMR